MPQLYRINRSTWTKTGKDYRGTASGYPGSFPAGTKTMLHLNKRGTVLVPVQIVPDGQPCDDLDGTPTGDHYEFVPDRAHT